MKRKIIKIDESKCNGCGLCAEACHEGAIGMVEGKAKLLRDDYCDGLGNCLPVCPTGAITFEEREAAEYDEKAVKAMMEAREKSNCATHKEHKEHSEEGGAHGTLACGCPGTHARAIERATAPKEESCSAHAHTPPAETPSQLRQWPVQIKLVPANASYLQNANLLIAADCTAYANGAFHDKFMKNRITLIGCPKLDEGDYADKLTAILQNNEIKSVTVVRMEVPCCGGIVSAVKTALQRSGKMIPWQIVTISTEGEIIED